MACCKGTQKVMVQENLIFGVSELVYLEYLGGGAPRRFRPPESQNLYFFGGAKTIGEVARKDAQWFLDKQNKVTKRMVFKQTTKEKYDAWLEENPKPEPKVLQFPDDGVTELIAAPKAKNKKKVEE